MAGGGGHIDVPVRQVGVAAQHGFVDETGLALLLLIRFARDRYETDAVPVASDQLVL